MKRTGFFARWQHILRRRQPASATSATAGSSAGKMPGVSAGLLAAAFAAMAAGLLLYGFRLGALAPANSVESATVNQIGQGSQFDDSLLLAPYKLAAAATAGLPGNDLTNGRLAAAGLLLAAGALLFAVVRRWHGGLVAGAASLLFLTSSWSLHSGRQAAGYAMLSLAVIALIAGAAWLGRAGPRGRALVAFSAASGLALTIPGGSWFVLLTGIVVYKPLRKAWRQAGVAARLMAGCLAAAGTAVLAASCLLRPGNSWQALAIPPAWPPASELLANAGLAAGGFFVRGPGTTESWLAHTPLLDIASTTFVLLGVLLYVRHLTNTRSRLLAGFVILGTALTVLNGSTGFHFLTPVVYLLLASGLAYTIHQWRTVFPRNPVAGATAICLLGLLITGIVAYHTNRYFIAWRYSPATAEALRSEGRPAPQLPYLLQ